MQQDFSFVIIFCTNWRPPKPHSAHARVVSRFQHKSSKSPGPQKNMDGKLWGKQRDSWKQLISTSTWVSIWKLMHKYKEKYWLFECFFVDYIPWLFLTWNDKFCSLWPAARSHHSWDLLTWNPRSQFDVWKLVMIRYNQRCLLWMFILCWPIEWHGG